MIHKLLDLYPKLSFLPEDELEFLNFSAVAVPVSPGKKPRLHKNRFLTALTNFTKIDLNIELSNWSDFTANAGELIEIPLSAGTLTRIYLIGTGDQSPDDIRKAATALGRKVKTSSSKVLSALTNDKNLITTQAVAFSLSNYQFSFKREQNNKKPELTVYGDFENEMERADVLATAVWQARNLIHTPSNIKNPEWLATQASAMVAAANNSGLSILVKSKGSIKEFGGLTAVGNSSPNPGPRLIEITYAPKGASNLPHVVLVGKGITFDTGGVSLKRPYDTMIGMKSDMAGAAAVLCATIALARTKPKVKVTTLLMAAENALSATAQRPSDVIKHYGGTTVEVINTDAEGRLVLADGLAYADLELDPDYLVDVATLTSAATLGLGRQYAAMYTRQTVLAKKLSEVGNKVGEKVWHMPLVDDYIIALASDVADFNHTADKYDFSAGSVTAALFLEQFVGDRAWVHLDIAGAGRSEVDVGENIKGGTGFGTRLLIEWLDTF
jgi:leucyl aminopeptidase